MASADKIGRDIDQATRSRDARVAILISDNIGNALDMLDEQPTAVLQAMIECHGQQLRCRDEPQRRHKFRAALIEYLEQLGRDVGARERRLAQAITGGDQPDDYTPGMS